MSTIYEHQGFPDLLLILPCVPILGASACSLLWNAGKLAMPAGIAIAFSSVLFLFSFWTGSPFITASYSLQDQKALAGRVQALEQRYGSIYAVGCAHLLAFNHQNTWSVTVRFSGVLNLILKPSLRPVVTFRGIQESCPP
jgi:hypothetical protein